VFFPARYLVPSAGQNSRTRLTLHVLATSPSWFGTDVILSRCLLADSTASWRCCWWVNRATIGGIFSCHQHNSAVKVTVPIWEKYILYLPILTGSLVRISWPSILPTVAQVARNAVCSRRMRTNNRIQHIAGPFSRLSEARNLV
jgi:hypothetical protein